MIQDMQNSESSPQTTRHSHPMLQRLPGAFMLLFLAAGAILALTSKGIADFPRDRDVIKGDWAVAYEKTFNQGLPWRQAGIDAWGAMEYLAFQNGRPGVLIGQNGWLFTTEEFQFFQDEQKEIAHKLKYIQQVHRQLQDQGIHLLVALIPAKARVYEDQLGRYPLPLYTRNRYVTFREALLKAGISAPDLLTPLVQAKTSDAVFLRTDTHWTPHGAGVVAETLKTELNGLQLDLPTTDFETLQGEDVEHAGDLLKYIPLGSLQNRGPEPDHFTTKTTEQVTGDASALLDDGSGESSEGLLGGEESIPIALVGTSYSFMDKFHFAGALKEALQVDVLNMALEGKGPLVPMQEYLRSAEFRDTPPQVVIWEIPERFLPVAYPEDQG